MLNNIVIRLNDILLRTQKLGKRSGDKTFKETPGKPSREFIAVCNRVLHAIGKGEYQEANKLLISGYEKSKNNLDRLASQKQPQSPPP